MQTKQVAVLFLYLFSFQYVLGVALATRDGYGSRGYPDYWRGGKGGKGGRGGYGGGGGRYGGGGGGNKCSFSKQLLGKLNSCYEKAGEAPDTLTCPDQKNDEVELSKINVSEQKMGKGSFECRLEKGVVRIDMKILYLSLLLSGVFNLVTELLGGLLGGLGKTVGHLLGSLIGKLLHLLGLNIVAEVVLIIVPGKKLVVESVEITSLTVKVLGIAIGLRGLLIKLLSPILLLLVKNVLVENFLAYFIECIGIVNLKDIRK